MKLHNLKPAHDLDVSEWIQKSIPELTAYQKEKIRDNEIVRFAPFEFFKIKKPVKNVLVRLTIILMPIVWVLIAISLPFNFLVTGQWGYGYKRMRWFMDWQHAVGL